MKTRLLALGALALGIGLGTPWLLRRTERPASHTTPALARSEAVPEGEADSPSSPPAEVGEVVAIDGVLPGLAGGEDPMRGEEQLQALVASVGVADLPTAFFKAGEDRGNPLHAVLQMRLLRRWAGSDPQAAAAALNQTRLDAEARAGALEGVAIEWATRDLPAVLAWVRQLPDVGERQATLATVGYQAARGLPREALAIAFDLTDPQAREALITHAAGQWAATAPTAAAAWAQQLAEPELRERTLAAVATAWADRDPVAAGTLAVYSIEPGRAQNDAVVAIVQRWAQQRPAEAAAWVHGFPEGELRTTAAAMLSTSSPEVAGSAL